MNTNYLMIELTNDRVVDWGLVDWEGTEDGGRRAEGGGRRAELWDE